MFGKQARIEKLESVIKTLGRVLQEGPNLQSKIDSFTPRNEGEKAVRELLLNRFKNMNYPFLEKQKSSADRRSKILKIPIIGDVYNLFNSGNYFLGKESIAYPYNESFEFAKSYLSIE